MISDILEYCHSSDNNMKVKKLLVLFQNPFNFSPQTSTYTTPVSLLEVFADLLKIIKEQKYDMFITIDIHDTQN